MPTTQQEKHPKDVELHRREARDALIRRQVLDALGKPGDVLGTQVRLLWENHYRVNVVVGADITSPRIAHSYFLVADGDGNIVTSTPAMTKR
jgi:hypothetical protein